MLAVLFLMLAGKTCSAGKQIPNDGSGQRFPCQQQWEQELLREAVSFLCPALGYRWQWPEEREGSQESLGMMLSIQQLVLQEQNQWVDEMAGEGNADPGEKEREPDTLVTENESKLPTSAPEDMAELEGVILERDEDLLAEIDRENEAMRRQAALLQEQQNAPASQQVSGFPSLSLPYTMEQLRSLDYLKEHLYNVNRGTMVPADLLNVDTLLAMDMSLEEPESGGPKILIHHTHATEYFSDSDGKNAATLIVGVGDYLKELLETRYGIEVIHDRTVYPYNEAYSQALKNVEAILAKNPTIEVFIDLHRDAGGTKKYTVNVGGKETAHLMFFNGLSHNTTGSINYLPNDNQQANLAFSFQMKMAGDSLYPGLCKRNYLKAYRYNLHVLPRAVIVEVGDNNNTLQEAKNAMEPLAQILSLILKGDG